MFGKPVLMTEPEKCFSLAWTYVIKELDKCKKSRCKMNGSDRSGNVCILDHTYTNCVYHTGGCIFYASSTAENFIIFG